MRALSIVLCAVLLWSGTVGTALATDPPSAAEQAADAAAATQKAQQPFADVSRTAMDPSEANRAAAQAALADPAFSADAANKRSAAFADQAKAMLQPHIDQQQQSFQDLYKQDSSVMRLAGVTAAMKAHDTPPKFRLFASRSLDAVTLKDMVETARDHQDLVVVFRGLLPGEKINGLATFLAKLVGLKKDGPLPHVVLDPTPFRSSHVTVVPTLEELDRDGKVIASVRGMTNPQWLADRVAHGAKGDLGKYGPVQPVAEEDIVVVMQRELAKVDLKASAQKSLASFWSRQTIWPLTKALRDRTRAVDPSVVLTDGITGPDGTVLAYPGQRINPMDVMPFNLVVIVIDARDKAQLAFAARLVKKIGVTPVMVLTTAEIDWQSYQDHVIALGVPIYMLRQEIISRFALEHVPSVVTSGSNKTLDVREYAVGPSHAAGEADVDHHSAGR